MPMAKVDRRAFFIANGYSRDARRRVDSILNKSEYTDTSFELQDWGSEGNELGGLSCLRENQQAPYLVTIKDFIYYYIFSAKGMLTLRLVMTSVLNFAKGFFQAFTTGKTNPCLYRAGSSKARILKRSAPG
ncbi:hypothetical protein GX51_01533 [Blastomyces parvus]|uniref:Uncharacterized protein n=1 Tax=Blastomyces parvus TaxID=2060905 RepID=A0A2B7XGD5_9EURO|nr:hypothetical protein GX51_01533 [Blastomyces parvus]